TTDASFEDALRTYLEQGDFKDENYMVSPTSLRAALCLATEGADGQTRQELLDAMVPVKKASTAGIVGVRRRRIAKQWSRKAKPRNTLSKRKCRKKENIKRLYLQDSKMMSARKITARAHVTTGISFAFLPAHFAIT
ncbi:MAG: hypothetical protein IIT57_07560, partial [Treponema sp.]|nr:hypothetical protein [Treponema sp.]